MIPYVLLFLSLLLLFLEFFLPSGILAVGGIILAIFSWVMLYYQTQSGMEFFLFFILTFGGVALVIKLALWTILKTRHSKTIYQEADQSGYQASSFDQAAIGKIGIALCDLYPGGYVLIDNQKLSALSTAGYIEKGQMVEVIGGEGDAVLVKLSNQKEST